MIIGTAFLCGINNVYVPYVISPHLGRLECEILFHHSVSHTFKHSSLSISYSATIADKPKENIPVLNISPKMC